MEELSQGTPYGAERSTAQKPDHWADYWKNPDIVMEQRLREYLNEKIISQRPVLPTFPTYSPFTWISYSDRIQIMELAIRTLKFLSLPISPESIAKRFKEFCAILSGNDLELEKPVKTLPAELTDEQSKILEKVEEALLGCGKYQLMADLQGAFYQKTQVGK